MPAVVVVITSAREPLLKPTFSASNVIFDLFEVTLSVQLFAEAAPEIPSLRIDLTVHQNLFNIAVFTRQKIV